MPPVSPSEDGGAGKEGRGGVRWGGSHLTAPFRLRHSRVILMSPNPGSYNIEALEVDDGLDAVIYVQFFSSPAPPV